ncbi:MAG: hypothetical protein AAGB05_16560 [Pseudomonadota bacterium]
MPFNRFTMMIAAGMTAAPLSAFAVPLTYEFIDDSLTYCSDCGLSYDVDYLPQPPGLGEPGVTATATTTPPGSETEAATVYHEQFTFSGDDQSGGLGVNSDTPNDAKIEGFDVLTLEFDTTVTLLSFEIWGARNGQQGELGGATAFDYGRGITEIVLAEDDRSTGEFFSWQNGLIPTTDSGFLLHSVTIEVAEVDPEVIPVPPALPLLGGALGLLAWRARRAKKAA